MRKVRFEIAMSLDGYVAGPNQSEEHALGEGGMQLHEWILKLAAWREPHGREGGEVNASSPLVEESRAGVGAGIMGRGMFGAGAGLRLERALVVETPEVTHLRDAVRHTG